MFTTHSIDPAVSHQSHSKRARTVNLRSASAKVSKSAVRRQVPDEFRTFTRKKKHGPWGLIILLALIFGATVAGYYYWSIQEPGFQGESATMSVEAPANLVSGDTITYKIDYQNNDIVTLNQVQLAVQWPEGFYFDKATVGPRDETATTWDLPNVAPGAKASLTIEGQLVGAKDVEEQVIFRLSYEPENFSSEFQVKEIAITKITDTKLDLALESVDKILPGQDIALKATFKNTTKETLFDLRVDFTLPPDLEIASIEPALTDNAWQGDLQAGEEITVIVQGNIAEDAHTDQNWVVEIGQTNEEKIRRLVRARKDIGLVNPQLAMEFKINGRDKDFEADWGETLQYSLKLTNSATTPLNDLQVSVLMDSAVLDFDSYKGSGRLDKNNVIFDKDTTSELSTLGVTESVILTWQINIVGDTQPGRVVVDNVAKVVIEGLAQWQQTSPLLIVSIGDGLSFRQGAYYNLGGAVVGSGPLPPKAGAATNYLIIWSLDNGTEDFSSVTASTILPPQVTFVNDDNVDEGEVSYDPTLRRVTWQIDNFQSALLPLQASWEIRLEPTATDVGKIVTLVNDTTVIASGGKEFQSKVSSLRSSQVVSESNIDVGTVVE